MSNFEWKKSWNSDVELFPHRSCNFHILQIVIKNFRFLSSISVIGKLWKPVIATLSILLSYARLSIFCIFFWYISFIQPKARLIFLLHIVRNFFKTKATEYISLFFLNISFLHKYILQYSVHFLCNSTLSIVRMDFLYFPGLLLSSIFFSLQATP